MKKSKVSVLPSWTPGRDRVDSDGNVITAPIDLDAVLDMVRSKKWKFAVAGFPREEKELLLTVAEREGECEYIASEVCDHCDSLHTMWKVHGNPSCMVLQIDLVEGRVNGKQTWYIESVRDRTEDAWYIDDSAISEGEESPLLDISTVLTALHERSMEMDDLFDPGITEAEVFLFFEKVTDSNSFELFVQGQCNCEGCEDMVMIYQLTSITDSTQTLLNLGLRDYNGGWKIKSVIDVTDIFTPVAVGNRA